MHTKAIYSNHVLNMVFKQIRVVLAVMICSFQYGLVEQNWHSAILKSGIQDIC